MRFHTASAGSRPESMEQPDLNWTAGNDPKQTIAPQPSALDLAQGRHDVLTNHLDGVGRVIVQAQ